MGGGNGMSESVWLSGQKTRQPFVRETPETGGKRSTVALMLLSGLRQGNEHAS